MDCQLCNFNNPKVTVTGIIIRDNCLLVLKRDEEPHKGQWDLPGGYSEFGELPEQTLARELSEELGLYQAKWHFLKDIAGESEYQGKKFAVLAKFYLVDFIGDIKLNDENSGYAWVRLKDLDPLEIAFDTNREMADWVKQEFTFDLNQVETLLKQLDNSFEKLNEYAFYQSMLDGHMETVYDGNLLIGMGWIYPRQTALRHQAVVEDMIVDEAYRGKGYGDKLLQGLEDWAKKRGVEVIELTSGWWRKPAHALYQRHGFIIHDTAHMLKKL